MEGSSVIVHKSLVDNIPGGNGAAFMAVYHPRMVLVGEYYYPIPNLRSDFYFIKSMSDLGVDEFVNKIEDGLPIPVGEKNWLAFATPENELDESIATAESCVYNGLTARGFWCVKDIKEYKDLYKRMASMKNELLANLTEMQKQDDYLLNSIDVLQPLFVDGISELCWDCYKEKIVWYLEHMNQYELD